MDGRNERVEDERRREERFGSLDVVGAESEARVGEMRRKREKERECCLHSVAQDLCAPYADTHTHTQQVQPRTGQPMATVLPLLVYTRTHTQTGS